MTASNTFIVRAPKRMRSVALSSLPYAQKAFIQWLYKALPVHAVQAPTPASWFSKVGGGSGFWDTLHHLEAHTADTGALVTRAGLCCHPEYYVTDWRIVPELGNEAEIDPEMGVSALPHDVLFDGINEAPMMVRLKQPWKGFLIMAVTLEGTMYGLTETQLERCTEGNPFMSGAEDN